MNPFSLYAARHAGDINPPAETVAEGPTYPTQSECWVCGTIVFGQPTTSLRRCSNGHEEVQWNERLPGVADLKRPGNERTLHTSCP